MREPALDFPDYKSTALRHPKQPLVYLPDQVTETTGPQLGHLRPGAIENDLTRQHGEMPVGERITVSGRLLDTDGRPVRDSLVEIWQANASGRYDHVGDQHDAPLDPNFHGLGRTFTDDDGWYRFVTIRPGSYPWANHAFAWRPQHIHFSLLGNAPIQRLVTQMYFPGDPLLDFDPVYQSVPDEAARKRMVCMLQLDTGIENVALGYRFDIVLAGSRATPLGM